MQAVVLVTAVLLAAAHAAPADSSLPTNANPSLPDIIDDLIIPKCIQLPWVDFVSDEQREFINFFQKSWRDDRYQPYKLSDKMAAWFYSLGERKEGGQRKERPEMDPAKDPTRDRPESSDPDDPSRSPNDPTSRKKRSVGSCHTITSPMRLRKEFRQFTWVEKSNFLAALNGLKSFIPDPAFPTVSGFDILVQYHQVVSSPAAHGGAGFLPWHREYLWR